MSISAFPRIYFLGEMSWDPSLSNNFEQVHDPVTGTLTLPPGETLATVKQSLPVSQNRSWNHFGTHSAKFETVEVTGVEIQPGTLDRTDPIVGKPLEMNGRLVDLNPLTDHGTQIFFDSLRVGDGLSSLGATRYRRMFARFLNFGRNRGADSDADADGVGPASGADAMWEVCFPKDYLTPSGIEQSPALEALFAAVDEPEVSGIAIRFRTYRTLYYQNGIRNALPQRPRTRADLRTLYARGENFSNPVYSVVCGTIMPWKRGEPVGHPAGRMLMPVPGVGIGYAEVDPGANRLSLDFGSAIPESGWDLEKLDAGDLALIASAGGVEHRLATLTYDDYARTAYEARAGIIDVDISNAAPAARDAIAQGSLSVRQGENVILEEAGHVVIVEDRDIYLDEGETKTLAVKVLYRGVPAPQGTKVQVARYNADLRFEALLAPLEIDATGAATIDISAESPGFVSLGFAAYDPNGAEPEPPGGLNKATTFHVNIRSLPFDNALAANTPDGQLSWTWIYENVLAFWDTQNPVMARRSLPAINKPLHDRTAMESLVGTIRTLTHRSAIEQLGYMPPARDLSEGKRRLLHRWCDLVENGTVPDPAIGELGIAFTTNDPRVLPPAAD